MSPSARTTSDDWGPTPVMVMCASQVQQLVEHVAHRRKHTRVRPIGGLQLEQLRHLLVDVDVGLVGEALLQCFDHNVLALTQTFCGGCRLTLLTDHLPNVGWQRSGKWCRGSADAGLRRAIQNAAGQTAEEEIRPR